MTEKADAAADKSPDDEETKKKKKKGRTYEKMKGSDAILHKAKTYESKNRFEALRPEEEDIKAEDETLCVPCAANDGAKRCCKLLKSNARSEEQDNERRFRE